MERTAEEFVHPTGDGRWFIADTLGHLPNSYTLLAPDAVAGRMVGDEDVASFVLSGVMPVYRQKRSAKRAAQRWLEATLDRLDRSRERGDKLIAAYEPPALAPVDLRASGFEIVCRTCRETVTAETLGAHQCPLKRTAKNGTTIITLHLEMTGDAGACWDVVDNVLDSGVFQDAINEYDTDEGPVTVTSATVL